MAFKAGKPMPAALEFDRDDIEFAVPMRAARLRVHIHAEHFNAMNNPHTFCAAHSIR